MCRFDLDKDATPTEVYEQMVRSFAQILKSYAEMPLRESVTYMSDVVLADQGTPKRRIIGRWQVDRRSTGVSAG
jgi:hypothetical protein